MLTTQLPATEFELLNPINSPGSKISVDIVSPRRLSELELRSAARVVENQICAIQKRNSDSCRFRYPQIFITWYLPGMTIGAGAWAITHFDPILKINIMEWMLEHNPTTLDKENTANH